MKELIQKTISLLKANVKANLELINQNQVKIKEILRDPASNERSSNFEKHYEFNKNLLSENNDFINVQLTLINFLEKYKNTSVMQPFSPEIKIESVMDQEELFNLTLVEKLPFNKNHPCFDNEEFFNKLLKHFEKKEEYEKCQNLLKIKNSK